MKPWIPLCVFGLALGAAAYGAQRGFADAVPAPVSFALQGVNGREVGNDSYLGRWSLVFFGYTRCPDFCPTALITAGGVLDDLGPDADQIRVTFITVDPERDTASVLAAYLESFDPRIAALTGSPEQVAAAAKAFKVFFRKRGEPGAAGYSIDHTAAFWLLGPDGRPAEVFGYDIAAAALAAGVRRHMSAPPL